MSEDKPSAGRHVLRIKRAYAPAEVDDGQRVLVDRLWPRGLSRDRAQIGTWLKEVAPSADLRKWFGHDAARWTEFRSRYERELADNPAVAELQQGPVKRAALLARQAGWPVRSWRINVPSFSVYRDAVTPAADAPRAGDVILTRSDALDSLPPLRVLFREGGVLLVRIDG